MKPTTVFALFIALAQAGPAFHPAPDSEHAALVKRFLFWGGPPKPPATTTSRAAPTTTPKTTPTPTPTPTPGSGKPDSKWPDNKPNLQWKPAPPNTSSTTMSPQTRPTPTTTRSRHGHWRWRGRSTTTVPNAAATPNAIAPDAAPPQVTGAPADGAKNADDPNQSVNTNDFVWTDDSYTSTAVPV